MRLPVAVLAALAFLPLLGASPAPAAAGCHLIDCVEEVPVTRAELEPLSCETLWNLRNSIFNDYGFCFKTQRAKDWFNNADCKYDRPEDLPMSAIQKSNVEKIKAMESWKGC